MVMYKNIIVHCDSEMCNAHVNIPNCYQTSEAEKFLEKIGWLNEGLKSLCPSCTKMLAEKQEGEDATTCLGD